MAEYLPVADAVFYVTGIRPSPTTCWRWTVRNTRKPLLKSFMVGGRRVTTIEAVKDFVDARSGLAKPSHDRTQAMLDDLLS